MRFLGEEAFSSADVVQVFLPVQRIDCYHVIAMDAPR